jgi:hypothetical protein
LGVVILGVLGAWPRPILAQRSGARAYTLAAVNDGMQLRTPDRRVVFDYLTKRPADSGLTSPGAACFHPIDTLSGERLTPLSPDDHPHHPVTTWHNSRSLWMLNPNLAAIQPVTIRPGAPLTLRYRVVVHDGGTPAAIIQKLSDEWRHDTGLPNPGSEWTI